MRRAACLAVALGLGMTPAVGAHEKHQVAAAPPSLYEPPPPGSYALPVIQRVSDHRLLDEQGRPVPLLGLGEGQVALVSFIYTRCGDACPLALAALQRVDRGLAERPDLAGRARLVSVSFDPEHDPPARMAEMRRHMAPRGSWSFLTAADAGMLAPVLADYGQDAVELLDARGEPSSVLRHVLKVFLVDSRGDVRNIYSSGFLEPRLLLNDIQTVLEAAPTPPDSD